MLKSLMKLGEEIGVDKGFEDDLLAPNEDETIKIIKIENSEIKVLNEIEYQEQGSDKYKYFYKGGNDSLAGGTLGIGGVSPFFIDPSKIKEDKIERSSDFIDFYNEKYDDDLVHKLFDFFKNYSNKFEEMDVDWVYIKEFEGHSTTERHNFYIQTYITARQNKDIDWVEGVCTICGDSGEMRDIRLPFYSLEVTNYNFGLASNEIDKGPLQLCPDCELKIISGWKTLNNIFGNNYVLIPTPRFNSSEKLESFIRIAKDNVDDFEKLNNIMGDDELYNDLEFKFLVTEVQQSKLNILRSVSNYKVFAEEFEDEELIIEDDLKYFPASQINTKVNKVTNYFDLERILKSFFVNERNYPLYELYGDTFHFYQLYNTDLPNDLNSRFKHLLYAHRDELFSFIYESNPTALPKKSISKILETFLRYEIRNIDSDSNFDSGIVRNRIIECLNYFYFFNVKIYGEKNMKKDIEELKEHFDRFDEDSKQKIREIVNQDKRILYFLIGQFIRRIDNYRYTQNKNKIFSDFIESLNRKNAAQRFAENILQNQMYYIDRLDSKAKYIFDLTKDNLNQLFKDKSFSEVLIALISGYYADNILKTKYEGDE
ncbi:hypothetical protein [Methanonatronarchaeum sp. AMET6-2]|uniref:hypothetical protein n=1 Tax=Methanonatronarchaeum sp. AMET6-2 TaxID=2933293 RepID=UPI001FF65DD3|nr:hypothetical protein [Methanonatronarchaeum sp. AMET6-2]UOY10061.1 hypothetical protein MU439_07335 [Methanonatronarchaeum sp. AMET6-2]